MFRQRAGHMNWKRLTSIDIDTLLRDIDEDAVAELNSCIDNLTFAKFNVKDVENNSCEAIVKLVQLMQLITEYLLVSQESQTKALVVGEGKNRALKKKNAKLEKELLSLHEDVRIYKKQLLLLKSTADKNTGNYRYVLGGPEADDRGGRSVALIRSFLNNDESTREFMKGMMEQQRVAFLKEIAELTDGRSNKSHDAEIATRMRVVEERESSLRERERMLHESVVNASVMQTTLTEREARLLAGEKALAEAEDRWKKGDVLRTDSLRTTRLSPETPVEIKQQSKSAAVNTSLEGLNFVERLTHSQLQLRVKLFAASVLFTLASKGVMRRRQIAFSQWQRTVGKIKRNELERSNRLVAEDYATSRGREERLAQQLREEQQRSVVDQARVNTLKRQLDSRPEQSTITTRPTSMSDAAMMTSMEIMRSAHVRVVLPDYIDSADSESEVMRRVEQEISLALTTKELAEMKMKLAEEVMRRMQDE